MGEQAMAATLLESLRVEQRDRWLAGDPVPAETYLQRHNTLQRHEQQALELIYHEVMLREELGQAPQLAEYQERFPQLAAQLQALFEVHHAIASTDLLADSPTDSPDSAVPGPLPAIPRYEILDVLGYGGMGVVYRARHTQLNRLVALKMVLAGAHAGPEEIGRIRQEAETVARLQHPNIVQIYEVGEHQGCPYLALELVDGGSLAHALQGGPLPPRKAAEWILQLAQAVEAAHGRGVVHRDLKPANVLLTAEGVPKITDFGLAKRVDSDAGQTRTGAVMGTPSYMAPEQAEGRSKEVGPATDIYALGAILYEMLTGRPPFRAATLWETLDQVRTQEPAPPRVMQPATPCDLETICLKCLEKEPERRYARAGELADDLRRFLAGEPILARSFNVLERLARTLDRGHHDAEFRAWGNIVLFFAPVAFLAHLCVYLFSLQELPYRLGVLLPLSMFCLFVGVLFWRPGSHELWPNSPAARQFWSILLANLVGTTLTPVICGWMIGPGDPAHGLAHYPIWAVLAGVTCFSLGGNYWGRLYLVGLISFATAVLMTWNLAWAPLEFGTLLGLTHVAIGVRLRRRARQHAG